jgi:hypothetical protein
MDVVYFWVSFFLDLFPLPIFRGQTRAMIRQLKSYGKGSKTMLTITLQLAWPQV